MIAQQLAKGLDLPTAFVEGLARSASHEYKTYQIAKRTGGHRTIHHPSRRLKALQRWLLVNVIQTLPIHPNAMAYRKGRSILDNAHVHVASRYLLRMDFTDFFASITRSDIVQYIIERPGLFPGWAQIDIDTFCGLVCRNSVLTIGAPTSPALSNAVCYEMDALLSALSEKIGVTYSRYADDLFFSTTTPNVLRQLEAEVGNIVSQLRVPGRLEINPNKTRRSSKRGRRRVTGIVLGSDGNAYVGRALKRKIRSLIFTFDSLDKPARASLAGMLAHVTGLDPHFMNSLIKKYGPAAVHRATRPHKMD